MPNPSLALSPRRPTPLSTSPSHRRRLATAITLPPPPIAAAYLTSISLFIYFSTRPLLSRLASLYLGTRVRLHTLRISPFRRYVSLGGIRLSDPRGRPLVAVDDLTVALKRPSKTTPADSETNQTPKNDPQKQKRVIDITLTKPAVVALFDKYDFSESNWTLFVSTYNKRHSKSTKPTTTTSTKPAPKKDSTRISPPTQPATPATDVRVSISGGVRLSLRSALLNNQRLVNDVTLSNVTLSYSELRSPSGLASFVDALAGRAVRSARVRSFPAEFRTGARRYARRVLAEGLAEGIRVGRERVKKVRQGVERVDEFVFSDLPDAGNVSEVVKTVRNVLRGVESLLGGNVDEEESSRGENGGGGAERGDRGDVEYRELDEGEASPADVREERP